MFPLINKQARRGVTIPDLAGGVNLRDGITEVLDNQMTDCKNMWFKDGVLRTRPAISKIYENYEKIYGPSPNSTVKTRMFKNIKNTIDGEVFTLCACVIECEWKSETTICFYWLGKSKTIDLGSFVLNETGCTFFVVLNDLKIYCYISNGMIFKRTSTADEGEWKDVYIEDIYVPTVFTHCKADGELHINSENRVAFVSRKPYFSGTQVEGFNIIGNSYKAVYSTVNKDLLTSTINTVPMHYPFPIPLYECAPSIDDLDRKSVTVTITYPDGRTVTHTAEIQENYVGEEEKTNAIDGLKLYVGPYDFSFGNGEYAGVPLSTEDFIEDNMEIVVPYILSDEEKDKIFSMTQSEWFGGASAGISGGTRLFLCGNTKENEKNLVVYSDLSKPLYFPENNHMYVGGKDSAVTGLGKQSDMLVIFKENETYFTQYTRNENITAENLINQTVIDYTSSSVCFPLTLISPVIGCDLPDTIELCRNRLVWATGTGKVYTLTANNQYSERNVYEVGEMVYRRLREVDLTRASACDWNGYYVLLADNTAFLMDYNSSGFQYVYSYQKNEDANVKIPWYLWEFNYNETDLFTYPYIYTDYENLFISGVFVIEGNEHPKHLINFGFTDGADDAVIYEKSGGIDFKYIPVSCKFTTKLFNFGAANYRKNIDSVGLSLGANGGVLIEVTFITDCGENTEFVTLYSGDTENYTAGHIQSVGLNPSIRAVIRFGVRLSCNGVMSVDGATINYRLLGPAR